MATTQTLIENIIIALIKTQSPFTTSPASGLVFNYDATGDTVTAGDRVTVRCGEPVPEVPAKTPAAPGKVMRAEVTITITATANSGTIDTWAQAIDAALPTSPSAVVTLATSSFPNGFELDAITGGDRQQEGSNQRERTKTLQVVFRL